MTCSVAPAYPSILRTPARPVRWEDPVGRAPLAAEPPPRRLSEDEAMLRNGAVAALGTGAGIGVGWLAGSQVGTLAATAGGFVGLVGGFATGFLAGDALARRAGAGGPLPALAGTLVGLSSASLSAVGGAVLGATSASPAAALVLAVLGGVGGYLAAQPFLVPHEATREARPGHLQAACLDHAASWNRVP